MAKPLTYDQIIKNRKNGSPMAISSNKVKDNVLADVYYDSETAKNFQDLRVYGKGGNIYWLQNSGVSDKPYALYTLRIDGTLMVHYTTNKSLQNFDYTSKVKESGIVCNIYQAFNFLIPISTDNGAVGILFDSEKTEILNSEQGVNNDINKDAFLRLTGQDIGNINAISLGYSFYENNNFAFPLFNVRDITVRYSTDPNDYYGFRCNRAISSSRGYSDTEYSPFTGDYNYLNRQINIEKTYPYGYISLSEYKKSRTVIKDFLITYSVYTFQSGEVIVTIQQDGTVYANDEKYNYLSANTLYIPLNASGLLWQAEYNAMLKEPVGSYDKIFEVLTGMPRGRYQASNPPPESQQENPEQPIDTTPPDDNPAPPPVTTNPPIDTTPPEQQNPNDPDITDPEQSPDTGIIEQNSDDTTGDVNTNADVTNTQNINTDLISKIIENYNLDDILKELGTEVRELGSDKIEKYIDIYKSLKKEETKKKKNEVGILIEDKGKIKIPVVEKCDCKCESSEVAIIEKKVQKDIFIGGLLVFLLLGGTILLICNESEKVKGQKKIRESLI